MELMTELFEVVSSLDSRDQCFTQILRACADHQALALKPQNKLQPIIGHINRKLNTPSSRADGLALLKSFLPQCSDDVFIESAVSWMLQCIKGIEGNCKQKTGQISYETLELLLELSGKLPELTKPVANTVVPKLLEQLQSTPQQISWAALQCLEVLMRNYGGPCGPNKNVLEKFILRFVDDENSHLVLAASRCASLLPLVGGGGTGGSNHRAAWLSLQQQLCAAMSQVLDELFQNITEIQSVPVVSSQKLAIPAISENNPTTAVHRLTTRFTNMAQFLHSMFRAEFPVAKAVLPDTVFGLLCRGLAVSCKTLGRKVSSETLTVSSVLPQIHLALLRVLRSLIACCGSTLLQYGSLICKLVLQTLKWTSVDSWCYGMERPYGRLRVEACNALGDWLICAKGGSCVELHADQLVVVLRSDIQTARTTVTLTVHAPTRKQLSKQQRKALAKKQAEHGSGAGSSTANTGGNRGRSRLVEQTANQGPCRAALRALQWIIRASGPFLQPSIHKTLQETVLLLLLEVQRASSPHEYPLPYSVPACRLELYSLLHSLTLEPHPGWPSPTQYALHTLAVGQRDPNLQVTGFCTVALSSTRNLVHPTHPSLEFPKVLEDMEEAMKTANTETGTKSQGQTDWSTFQEQVTLLDSSRSESSSGLLEVLIEDVDKGSEDSEDTVIIEKVKRKVMHEKHLPKSQTGKRVLQEHTVRNESYQPSSKRKKVDENKSSRGHVSTSTVQNTCSKLNKTDNTNEDKCPSSGNRKRMSKGITDQKHSTVKSREALREFITELAAEPSTDSDEVEETYRSNISKENLTKKLMSRINVSKKRLPVIKEIDSISEYYVEELDDNESSQGSIPVRKHNQSSSKHTTQRKETASVNTRDMSPIRIVELDDDDDDDDDDNAAKGVQRNGNINKSTDIECSQDIVSQKDMKFHKEQPAGIVKEEISKLLKAKQSLVCSRDLSPLTTTDGDDDVDDQESVQEIGISGKKQNEQPIETESASTSSRDSSPQTVMVLGADDDDGDDVQQTRQQNRGSNKNKSNGISTNQNQSTSEESRNTSPEIIVQLDDDDDQEDSKTVHEKSKSNSRDIAPQRRVGVTKTKRCSVITKGEKNGHKDKKVKKYVSKNKYEDVSENDADIEEIDLSKDDEILDIPCGQDVKKEPIITSQEEKKQAIGDVEAKNTVCVDLVDSDDGNGSSLDSEQELALYRTADESTKKGKSRKDIELKETIGIKGVLKKVTIEDSDPSPIKEPATSDNMEEEQGGTVEGSSQTLPNVESPAAKKIRVELANEEETYTSLNGIEDENKKENGPIVNRSADKEVIADEEDMLASFVDIVSTESVSKTINSAKSIVDG